jgi:phosphotransferase system HPr (HPr) family protein
MATTIENEGVIREETMGNQVPRAECISPNHFRGSAKVVNEMGLHVRPASEFVKLALTFESEIVVQHGSQQVDGKSVMDLLLLGAEAGSDLMVEGHGSDAECAVQALVRLIQNGFNE